jgi:membrane fusion protein, multidrug efflux system
MCTTCALKRGVTVACVAILFVAGEGCKQKEPGSTGRGGPGGGQNPTNAAVPILAGIVERKDVPIYLDGLGTVQAYNTVLVRSRVDGQIEKIAFEEGQDVHVGDLLAQIDPAPFKAVLDQNIARKAADEAQLVVARLNLNRNAELLANKILSQQDYDTQKALVDQLQAAVQADDANVNNARVQLAYATITSPIAGRTGIRMVDHGNIVHASDSNGIVVITQLRPISVVFTLPEQSLPRVQGHMAVGSGLQVFALDRDNRSTLAEGKLAVIDNQIDTTTGTIRLKATFDNSELRLWPGQFVNARLLLETHKGGLVVPASVVQRGPEGTYAYIIAENMTARVRAIKIAQIEQGEALIDEGLSPGERVVVDGQYKLQPGVKVRLTDSTPAVSADVPQTARQSGAPGGRSM